MPDDAYRRVLSHPLSRALVEALGERTCHAVGGTVRDALLGRTSVDLDVSVRDGGRDLAHAIAAATRSKAIDLGGERFASYRVVAGVRSLDIWDRQRGSLRADLERRDLTINSMACELPGGSWHDPFAGREDLDKKLLRATRLDTFERDPLRVLRLARFQLSLDGFSVDPATAAAARAAAPGLDRVAVERIRQELAIVLSFDRAAPAFAALETAGGLDHLLATSSSVSAAELHARADCLDRTRVLGAAGELWTSDRRRLAAVALLFPEGRDESLRDHASRLERSGISTRTEAREAAALAATRLPGDLEARRLFLAEAGRGWPAVLAVAAAREGGSLSRASAAAEALEALAGIEPELLDPPPALLDGHEVSRILGTEPGPAVGEALRALWLEQINGRVTTRQEAAEFVARRRP